MSDHRVGLLSWWSVVKLDSAVCMKKLDKVVHLSVDPLARHKANGQVGTALGLRLYEDPDRRPACVQIFAGSILRAQSDAKGSPRPAAWAKIQL